MTLEEFLKRYGRALGLDWKSPPETARQAAHLRPKESPLAEPPRDAVVERVLPEDIRSATGAEESVGVLITRSLAGVDVTFQVAAPQGDGLWVLEGRAWLNPPREATLKVALVQRDHVFAETDIRSGGTFRFADVLIGGWRLEFHLADGSVAILTGDSG